MVWYVLVCAAAHCIRMYWNHNTTYTQWLWKIRGRFFSPDYLAPAVNNNNNFQFSNFLFMSSINIQFVYTDDVFFFRLLRRAFFFMWCILPHRFLYTNDTCVGFFSSDFIFLIRKWQEGFAFYSLQWYYFEMILKYGIAWNLFIILQICCHQLICTNRIAFCLRSTLKRKWNDL